MALAARPPLHSSPSSSALLLQPHPAAWGQSPCCIPYARVHTHTHTHARVHTHMHTCTRTFKHVHTHAHTHPELKPVERSQLGAPHQTVGHGLITTWDKSREVPTAHACPLHPLTTCHLCRCTTMQCPHTQCSRMGNALGSGCQLYPTVKLLASQTTCDQHPLSHVTTQPAACFSHRPPYQTSKTAR